MLVHEAEPIKRIGVTLVGSKAIPIQCRGIILGNGLTLLMEKTQLVLRIGIAGLNYIMKRPDNDRSAALNVR